MDWKKRKTLSLVSVILFYFIFTSPIFRSQVCTVRTYSNYGKFLKRYIPPPPPLFSPHVILYYHVYIYIYIFISIGVRRGREEGGGRRRPYLYTYLLTLLLLLLYSKTIQIQIYIYIYRVYNIKLCFKSLELLRFAHCRGSVLVESSESPTYFSKKHGKEGCRAGARCI